ncbi:hypothetical protein Bca52824_024367 [Brassica carinata]|uniref:Ubiquitin-like protease family profile domain-containing protein n=1 Tax=Brassica carinata TaxID=52824 RepID=A0A8X7VL02_BRACI|nr:hypothetical protein Bca52824_024367 [Brassica carinata]
MFEGYILSLKGHFNSVGGLRIEVTISYIRDLPVGNPRVGLVSMMISTMQRLIPIDPQPIPVLQMSSQRDVEDVAETGTASVALDANPDEGEKGEDYLRSPTFPYHLISKPSSSVNIASPSNVDAPASVSMQGTPACSGKEQEGANPPSRVDVDPVNVSSECPIDDPVSGLVNKILSDAGVDKVKCTSTSSMPFKKVGIDGVHDDGGEDVVGKKGDDVDEDDVTITKVQAGRVNTDAAVVQADGGRRFSTRDAIQVPNDTLLLQPLSIFYTLMLVKDRHRIGMIVDLPMWAIYVADTNQTCPTTSVIKDVLKPISIMMPHMISRFCLTSRPRELNFLPFPISRLDIPVLLEHPGYSAVVALILLEISAVEKPMIDLSLTEEEVRVAAENYAISTLAMF